MENDIIYKIASGLIIPAIIALIKLYNDHSVLRSQHNALQAEVNELKAQIGKEFDKVLAQFDKRFEKLEGLIERYFTQRRRDDEHN